MPSKSVGVIRKYAIMTPFLLESDLKSLLYAWIPTRHLVSMKCIPNHHANFNSCSPCIYKNLFSNILENILNIYIT